uniref:NADH-ubiquinone oxidoreductase chain 6 n=1 Tax=Boulengerula taitana TaxID=102246 RepID=C8UZR8_BOUTA|nr:NADH dehydrogenase subunit 6 [Boulengerula taitana]AAX58646.1 NADH dehydrogenase subunit 6 [Boulengerula taitana]ACS37025.1 NADH dehydrogenase subunit 6 [Boulengerula taitana]
MIYMVFIGLVGLVAGLVAVASNPSPYFAAFGLVIAAAAGCTVLVGMGVTFLSMVLFLIYLGGMLVVFAYSTAMSAEPFPEAWGNMSVVFYVIVYLSILVVGFGLVDGVDSLFNTGGLFPVTMNWGGVAMMYSVGGYLLIVSGWVLLLALFVVLEVTRGVGLGAVSAV